METSWALFRLNAILFSFAGIIFWEFSKKFFQKDESQQFLFIFKVSHFRSGLSVCAMLPPLSVMVLRALCCPLCPYISHCTQPRSHTLTHTSHTRNMFVVTYTYMCLSLHLNTAPYDSESDFRHCFNGQNVNEQENMINTKHMALPGHDCGIYAAFI